MQEVRKRRKLKPEDKLQIYKEAIAARATGNGAVAEVLRRWGIHSSDLSRIARTVEEGAINQFKANKSRKPKLVLSDEEIQGLFTDKERLERTVIEQAAELALLKKNGI
jgi:transposase-like protein